MARCSVTFRAAALTIVALACSVPASAQMYPQDIHSQHRPAESAGRSQPSFGAMAMDSASALLQRRDQEQQDRREMLERQRRMMDNYTNLPDQLRESYPRRVDTPYGFR